MTKRSTITDVAKQAGVSVATVSRYFADNGYPVSKGAGVKINKAALALDYTPNIVGRMLKTNSSKDIGVIIPTIKNPFYPDVLLGIEKTAARRGYQILLCNSLRNTETEKKYMNSLYQKQVRGIIIAGADNTSNQYKSMADKGMYLINLEGKPEDSCCKGIDFNYKKGGEMLAEYLYHLGHREIAFVTSPLTKQSRRDFLAGVKKIFKIPEENIIIDGSEIESESGTYEYEMGIRLSKRVLKLKNRPSAVISVNDITGAGVIRGFTEAGLKVPEDISVAGFDNIELSSMISPPLTTINQPGFETGELAVNMLIDMIENKNTENKIIEPELVVRASTKSV